MIKFFLLEKFDWPDFYSLFLSKMINIFILQYIHSVALSPVEDYFKICNDKIVLDKTIYKDFGAGLPHMPVGNQKMTVNNGQVEITGYNMEFNSFDVRVGRVAKHKFIFIETGYLEYSR